MTRCMGIITIGARKEDIAKCQHCKLLPDTAREENESKALWVAKPKAPCSKFDPK